jgi:hypothetical protein
MNFAVTIRGLMCRKRKDADASFEVLAAEVFQLEAFWVCLHLQSEDGGSKVLRNVGILPQYYIASQPRRPPLNKDAVT